MLRRISRLLLVIVGITAPAVAPSSADDAVQEWYGQVFVTSPQGLVRPVESSSRWAATKEIRIDGRGGIRWQTPDGFVRLESTGHHGATLSLDAPDSWSLEEGLLEVSRDLPLDVRMGSSRVVLDRGHLAIHHLADAECTIRLFSGRATVGTSRGKSMLTGMDMARILPGQEPARSILMAPPRMVVPPQVVSAPLSLVLVPTDERMEEGAVMVECSTRRGLWEQSVRTLFGPGEPVMVSEIPQGRIFVRVSTVNRSGVAGPPSPAVQVFALNQGLRLIGQKDIFIDSIQCRIDPPLDGCAVRWGTVRTFTDTAGEFILRPEISFGLTVADLVITPPGEMAPPTREPVMVLSGADRLAVLASTESQSPHTVFVRHSSIRVCRNSEQAKVRIDGANCDESETDVSLPTSVRRLLTVFRKPGDKPIEMELLQDTEGPRILNVSLETRGSAERFYVMADILDLGIGIRLPARAFFENDAGQKFDMPLNRVSDIRLEGRAADRVESKHRINVWWVRVESEDRLGNRSIFEKTVYHRRHKKFLSVGLKDLAKIWKNKL